MASLEILERLISFPTVSRTSNLDLISFVSETLAAQGIAVELVHDETKSKANLHATVGPRDRPGVMLSGHSDVVPVEGQSWSVDPFVLTERDDKLYGRGTADMKGFVACAVNALLLASTRQLEAPLHLAVSYDEEIGCIGVRRLLDSLRLAPLRPVVCIVGEPTSMAVATGHKGKTALRARCIGREAHSALAPTALNAVHLACDFIAAIRAMQAEIAETGKCDGDYDVPYTTLHVGKIGGGVALNIVPNLCELDFEIRNIAEDDPDQIVDRLRAAAAGIARAQQGDFPEAEIALEVVNAYPGLNTPPSADSVSFVKSLTGANRTMKVAFGTEAGLFTQDLGVSAVVCGPGSMAQGHKPDEFVTREQIGRCDAMLSQLVERLAEGLKSVGTV